MTRNNIALSGLSISNANATQGSAAPQAATLHPGLRVLRPFGTEAHGESVSVPMVRDLAQVIDREKVRRGGFGFFVTLAAPTSKMKEEAVGLGFYKAEVYGPEYPKLQILIRRGGKA